MMRDVNGLVEQVASWLLRQVQPGGLRECAYGALGTSTGLVRNENQDQVATVVIGDSRANTIVAWILCDGIGSLQEGRKCAALTAATVAGLLYSRRNDPLESFSVAHIIRFTNDWIRSEFKTKSGCTLSLVVSSRRSTFAFNAGDSRIYAWGKDSFAQLSKDDILGLEIQKYVGSADPSNPFFRQLSQFIGMDAPLRLHGIAIPPYAHEGGILLTSDGAHNVGEILPKIVLNAPTPIIQIRRLLQLSSWTGGTDNASAIATCPLSKIRELTVERDSFQIYNASSELSVIFDQNFEGYPKRPDNVPEVASSPKISPKKARRKPASKSTERELIPEIELSDVEPSP